MPKVLSPLIPTLAAVRRTLAGSADELCPRVIEMELAAARQAGWEIDAPHNYCWRCGATMAPAGITSRGCAFCVNQPIAWDRIVRLGPYRPTLGRWIIAMKFRRAWAWAPWFGAELARAAAVAPASAPTPAPADRTIVCPVPMHFWRRLGRGYNQAQLMAGAFAAQRGWPVVHLLRRRRYGRPQTLLPISSRAANVRRAFAAHPVDLHGCHVWLVDDVRTTGATLRACTRLLRRAGAQSVSVAVAAVADPLGADFTILHIPRLTTPVRLAIGLRGIP